MSDVLLACRCGSVRGVLRDVTPDTVNAIVCHCDDCQAFARAIDRADVLDPHGGTLIVQVSPARLEITQGVPHLAALRLTDRGMVRWYTTCCRTPIGNTRLSPRPPYIGMPRAFLDRTADGRPPEDAFGPVRARLQAKFATGDPSTRPKDHTPVGAIVRMVSKLGRWWLRGDAKRSPLRDPAGAPIVTPRVLSAEELAAARSARA